MINKTLKTVSILATALVVSNSSNAWFWDAENDRELRMTAEGQVVPVRKEGWLAKATTYHEELKPTYNPETQRVERPLVVQTYNGVKNNTETATVKPAWYDRVTTYHKEDRRPWNPYDLAEKDIPAYIYYDPEEARAYNEHYSQEGLEPTPYMYGSASLVLRKERQVDELGTSVMDVIRDNQKEQELAMLDQDVRMLGMGNNIYIRPAGGFDSLDKRGAMNDMNGSRSGYISMSDPLVNGQNVKNYNNVMIGNPVKSDVQAVTKIDKPKTNWRDKLTSKVDMSRPGDFDYKKPEEKTVEAFSMAASEQTGYNDYADYSDGQVIAGTGQNENYDQYMNVEKVNNYVVEDGDTLSEISDKERIYGDWTLWPLIYDANRNQVQDPDLILPGQDLDIPRDYDEMAEDDARYRAKNRELPISLYDNQ